MQFVQDLKLFISNNSIYTVIYMIMRKTHQGGLSMKKIVSILLVLALVSAGLFAFDMSAGGVFDFTGTANSRKMSKDSDYMKEAVNINVIGFKGYFDAQYAVAEIGMNVLVGKQKQTYKNTRFNIDSTDRYDVKATFLNMGIFGKYPFAVAEKIKVFPMLGLDFDIPLSVKVKVGDKYEKAESDDKKEYNRVWLDMGAGADFFVTDNFYVRPQAMFGIKLNETKEDKDTKELAKAYDTKFSKFGYKFNIGVGVGYKF